MMYAETAAIAVTSGTHLAGALEGESWDLATPLDWIDRALIQGVDEPEEVLKFLPSANERQKRKLVANMVPPPFARAMQMAVDRVLQNALQIGRRVGENVAGSLPPTPKEPADRLTAPGLGADPCPIDVEQARRSVRFFDERRWKENESRINKKIEIFCKQLFLQTCNYW